MLGTFTFCWVRLASGDLGVTTPEIDNTKIFRFTHKTANFLSLSKYLTLLRVS